jgi:hypothetical protein
MPNTALRAAPGGVAPPRIEPAVWVASGMAPEPRCLEAAAPVSAAEFPGPTSRLSSIRVTDARLCRYLS